MLALLYVVIGVALVAVGVGLYLYRRPLEEYDRYLQSLPRHLYWPGPEKWQEFQERARSVTIRFVVPGFLILLGTIVLVAVAASL